MKKFFKSKEKILLTFIVILSAVLNFANIGIEGYANEYYAAGIKSMTMSLKNFFFVSFDPAGFVSIDKPPLGFWLQAISAKIFGYYGWSIILPQAIAGVLSVIVIYHIVKRSFNGTAGLISALCLATTPIFVAVSRNNTIDNTLILVLLLACWALSIAAEKGKLKYLLISLALVGVGFNVKMLQAYMVAPALYIVYLLTSAVSFKKKILHLIAGTVVLVAVSLSWAVVVDMVPASSRPFVGSSTNNSVMELIFGHNGLERLTSSNGMGGAGGKQPQSDGEAPQITQNGNKQSTNNSNSNTQSTSQNQQNSYGQGTTQNGIASNPGQTQSDTNGNNNWQMQGGPGGQPNDSSNGQMQGGPGGQMPNGNGRMQGGPGGGGSKNSTFGGTEESSIFRLFSNNSLSDQIIWLLPIALFGFAAAAIKEKLKFSLDNSRKQSIVMWIMWLLPMFIYFSFTKGLFHPYYLTMMAPPIAALTGIGFVSMWDLRKEGGWKSWLLPAAILTDAAVQLLILSYYYNSSNVVKVLMGIVTALCLISTATMQVEYFKKSENSKKIQKILVGTALLGLLITPFLWSSTTLFYTESGTFPSAGIELATTGGGMGGAFKNSNKGQGNMMEMPGSTNNSNGSGASVNANNSTTGTQENTNNNTSSNTNNNSQNNEMGLNNMDGKPSEMGESDNAASLYKYLKANTTTEKYLVAISSANGTGSSIIIKYGGSVMALGGFSGSDNILSLSQFKQLVKNGTVRYIIVGGAGGAGGSSEIMSWAQKNGKLVSESVWSGKSTSTITNTSTTKSSSETSNNRQGGGFREGNSIQLYDLKGTVK